MVPTATLPVIDLRDALQPGASRSPAVAEQLRAAAMVSGFFYVINHGVPDEQVSRQFEMAQAVLDVPSATKERLAAHLSRAMHGYELMGSQTLDGTARPDVKESFYCGMAYPDDHPYVVAGYPSYGDNRWPPEVPQAPSTCEAYIQAMLALSQRLMQLLALSLDLPEDWFDAASRDPMVTLRMLRYPPHPADADERTFGAGEHTDWGAITVLAQDRNGGLEVRMPDGGWVAAPPLAGAFVVNLGDMVPRWTNDRYHSNPHRVRNVHSGGAPRYSIPFFYQPDYMAVIEPVPGCVPPGETPRHASCTVGEHLVEMYRRTYNRPLAMAGDTAEAATP